MRHAARRVLTAVAIIALALFSNLGQASATEPPAFAAQILTPVLIDHRDPSVAYVQARYICDEAPDWHLWVSIKQNVTGTQDDLLDQEHSSQVATTWLQTHPTDLTCDGVWHVQRFTLDTLEQGFGDALQGVGWFQFCLIDFADESFQRAVIIQEWRAVR